MQRSRSGQGAIRKKKNVSFNYVVFDTIKEISSNIECILQDNLDIHLSVNLPLKIINWTTSCKKTSRSQSNNEGYVQKLLNFLIANENTCKFDEDTNFSYMIVPRLRKLNDDQRNILPNLPIHSEHQVITKE